MQNDHNASIIQFSAYSGLVVKISDIKCSTNVPRSYWRYLCGVEMNAVNREYRMITL